MSTLGNKINELRESIGQFENWISSGCKGKFPPNTRKELLKLFGENKDAYSLYRNYLFNILTDLDSSTSGLNEFIQYVNLCSGNPLHDQIISEFLKDAVPARFEDQRMNLTGMFRSIGKQKLSNGACFIYQSYYEIDAALLLLASIRKLNEESVVDLDLKTLRDRSGNLKKGVAINFIKAGLRKYPHLATVFHNAYNVKLRNSIGHNNYRISNNRIESLDKTISVAAKDFFESLWCLQQINNFLLFYFSSYSLRKCDLSECGFLSLAFGLEESQPVLVLHQLECFYQLNRGDHRWINNITFSFSDAELTTTINDRVTMKGNVIEGLVKWFNDLKIRKKLRVLIRPISPVITGNDVLLLDCGEFQELEMETRMEVSYDIKYRGVS